MSRQQELEAKIPPATLEALKAWIKTARPVGHFVTCVLSNDLAGAFSRADEHNRAAMFEIVSWLYNYAPSACWGSRERVREWRESRLATTSA